MKTLPKVSQYENETCSRGNESGADWHGKQTQWFPSHSLHTLWCIMKQSRRSHIKVARSSPLSSLSLSLLSNNDPIMSSHYSDSALLLKQVILYLQLDSLLLVWLIHTPFLSPCLALGRKETEKRDLPHGRLLFYVYHMKKKRLSLFIFMVGLGRESQEPTWGAIGLRTGWFVWRSPFQPKKEDYLHTGSHGTIAKRKGLSAVTPALLGCICSRARRHTQTTCGFVHSQGLQEKDAAAQGPGVGRVTLCFISPTFFLTTFPVW